MRFGTARLWRSAFFATLISIMAIAVVSRFFVKREIRGEFVQASYRSSAALLGIAFIQNIYGDAGMAPLMIIGTVPLYNIMAVLVLSFMNPAAGKLDKLALKKAAVGIVTNPILWGIAVGLIWSLCRIPQPEILKKSVDSVAALATPMGLMAMGAGFEGKKALAMVKTHHGGQRFEAGDSGRCFFCLRRFGWVSKESSWWLC